METLCIANRLVKIAKHFVPWTKYTSSYTLLTTPAFHPTNAPQCPSRCGFHKIRETWAFSFQVGNNVKQNGFYGRTITL